MQYRKNLSVLGYGCMRFTRKAGSIDQEKAEREMKLALEKGVNYFDTAYIYPGCEVCLGKFLKKYECRDQVNIATKLPHYLLKNREDMDRFFGIQLERLQTDHVEFYLIHMLNHLSNFERLESLGLSQWIREKKQQGKIGKIGFSFHGNTEMFLKILDAYPWDFVQIQYNYMDEHSQAGRRGLMAAAEKELPVIIMEPLRGGRLVNGLPESAGNLIGEFQPQRSPAEWGLRWIYHQPEATVVLSGMNESTQVEENARIADEAGAGCMSGDELSLIGKVKEEIRRYTKVPCTGCGYCLPCPKGVDIPACFQALNMKEGEGYKAALSEYMKCTSLKAEKSNASLCVGCGKCEQICPQSIPIRKELKAVVKALEGTLYKAGCFFASKIGHFK